eukprot:scaffold63_cov306-Pinguiococcus_pyrenoidosus.AAC.86
MPCPCASQGACERVWEAGDPIQHRERKTERKRAQLGGSDLILQIRKRDPTKTKTEKRGGAGDVDRLPGLAGEVLEVDVVVTAEPLRAKAAANGV